MKASTPAPNSGTDARNDPPCGRNTDTETVGDVDENGDLVDELDERLRGAITATTPELADDQLRNVRQLLRPWTVRP